MRYALPSALRSTSSHADLRPKPYQAPQTKMSLLCHSARKNPSDWTKEEGSWKSVVHLKEVFGNLPFGFRSEIEILHCIPFCIPEHIFAAKSRQPWQMAKMQKPFSTLRESVTSHRSNKQQKVGFWIFSPLLYRLSYPANGQPASQLWIVYSACFNACPGVAFCTASPQ